MPDNVADLGGLSLISWVFSAYLLAQTVTTVVSGRLADMRGRYRAGGDDDRRRHVPSG